MSKLCTLKELVPGSVIEIPEQYRGAQAELGVVLGLGYNKGTRDILPSFIRRGPMNELITTALPALHENTEFNVVEDKTFSTDVLGAFVAHKLALPELGMSAGCDPEIFVEHEDGSIFPAWEFMPDEASARSTSKEWMTQLFPRFDVPDDTIRGYNWQNTIDHSCPRKVPAYWDGAQAEFAPWAKSCLETLHYGTRVGLKAVLDFAKTKDPKAKLTLSNVIELPKKVLQETDDKYIRFRCSQSYNIYDDLGEGIPDAREYKYRCAGGHIHIGYQRTFTAPAIEQIVRGLDGVLGVIGVSLAAGIDNPERRRTYGRAGEFRLPSHGIEYRVLSNFWLSHPAIAMLVFDLTRAIVRFAESGLFNLCWIAKEEETREVINNCDVQGARNILARNKNVVAGLIQNLWSSQLLSKRATMQDHAMRTILNGIGVVIDNPYDIAANWVLNDDAKWKIHCRGEKHNWRSLCESLK
jgi:hypothetical protein